MEGQCCFWVPTSRFVVEWLQSLRGVQNTSIERKSEPGHGPTASIETTKKQWL